MANGVIKCGHESGVVPGIVRGPAVETKIDQSPPTDPCEDDEMVRRVRFVDDPRIVRGRGRLDLATGERIR